MTSLLIEAGAVIGLVILLALLYTLIENHFNEDQEP